MKHFRAVLGSISVTFILVFCMNQDVIALQAPARTLAKIPTPSQQTAINVIAAALQESKETVAARRTALNEVTFATPLDESKIKEAAAALGFAEQDLALALADKFAGLQASPEQLTPELIPVIEASMSRPRSFMGGGFGRRVRPSENQQLAINGFNAALDDKTQLVAKQRDVLNKATYALPVDENAIRTAIANLGAAEQDLALARAAGFARLQASADKLGPELVQLMVSSGGAIGGGRGRLPAASNPADALQGFTSLFDGKTLNGWDGDPLFWRAEDGLIIGESTPEKVVKENTFLIWRDGNVKNFELKVEVRFATNEGNSGVQVRSRALTEGRDGSPRMWGIGGYQVDMVPEIGTGSGLIYGEGGGGFMARQGTVSRRHAEGINQVSTLGDDIPAYFNPAGEWNSYHVIARDNTISVYVNGRMVSFLIDEHTDPEQGYATEGLLALQLHTGDPFRLEFKNVYLKEL